MTTEAAMSGGLTFLQLVDYECGAEGGTRTPTVLLPPAPQAGASANSATSARRVGLTWAQVPAPAALAPAAQVRPALSGVALVARGRRRPMQGRPFQRCRGRARR